MVSLLQGVGFPIVCCFGLGWYISKQSSEHRSMIKELSESWNKTLDSLGEAIKENTKATTSLDRSILDLSMHLTSKNDRP